MMIGFRREELKVRERKWGQIVKEGAGGGGMRDDWF